MTLAEVLMVVSIIGIIIVATGFQFIGWYGTYRVESAVKDIYADLLDARTKALQRNRPYFVDFNFPVPPANSGRYRVATSADLDADGYVDQGDTDGNGEIEAGHAFEPTFPKTIEYVLTWNNPGTILTFDKRGMISPQGTICLTASTNVEADYDCIEISWTRINLGRLDTRMADGGPCNAANCVAK